MPARAALAIEIASRHGEAHDLGRASLLESGQALGIETLVPREVAQLGEVRGSRGAQLDLEDPVSHGSTGRMLTLLPAEAPQRRDDEREHATRLARHCDPEPDGVGRSSGQDRECDAGDHGERLGCEPNAERRSRAEQRPEERSCELRGVPACVETDRAPHCRERDRVERNAHRAAGERDRRDAVLNDEQHRERGDRRLERGEAEPPGRPADRLQHAAVEPHERLQDADAREHAHHRHARSPLLAEGEGDDVGRDRGEPEVGRQRHQAGELRGLVEGAPQALRLVLQPREDRESDRVDHAGESLGDRVEDLAGDRVVAERGGSEEAPDQQGVDALAQQAHELEADDVRAEERQLAKPRPAEAEPGPPARNAPERQRTERSGGERLTDEAPHAMAGESERDRHDARAELGHERALRQLLEAEAPDQERLLRARQPSDQESEGEPAQHRRELCIAEPARDRVGEARTQCSEHRARRDAGPEGRVEMLAVELSALHHGWSEALVHEPLAEVDHDRRERDETEGLGAELPREHDEDGEPQELVAPALDPRPGQPARGVLAQAHQAPTEPSCACSSAMRMSRRPPGARDPRHLGNLV